jgi:hypothetical protein
VEKYRSAKISDFFNGKFPKGFLRLECESELPSGLAAAAARSLRKIYLARFAVIRGAGILAHSHIQLQRLRAKECAYDEQKDTSDSNAASEGTHDYACLRIIIDEDGVKDLECRCVFSCKVE